MYSLKLLRKLARSYQWQTLYNHSKKIGSLKLFENSADLTQLQLDFLRWLEVYNILYKELASEDHKNLTEDIINDDIRTEAYLLFRAQDDKKNKGKKRKKKRTVDNKKIPTVLFKKG